MKKALTTIAAIVLTFTMVLGMSSAVMASENVLEGSKPVKIGILYANWTSRCGVLVQKYCDYIGKELNIEFEYYTSGFDAESCIAGVENMVTSGCDGVITLVTTGVNQQAAVCQEAEIPYAVIQGIPKDAEMEQFKTYDCVASLIYTQTPSTVGTVFAENMLALGYKNIAVIHMPTGMLETQDQMVAQMMEDFTAGGGTIVAEAQDMPNTQPETAETLMMNYGDQIDAVWGVLDCILSGIQASGKDVPVICHDLPLEDPASYFENNIIAFDLYDIPEKIGFNVVSIINMLNGDVYPDQPEHPFINSPYTEIRNAEECEMVVELTEGTNGFDPWYTADELKDMIIAYNPDATWAEFEANCVATQLPDLAAHRGVELSE